MTAAQNKARARFKAAVKEAAKLRKANPKLSQADAVKKAFAALYGKEGAGRKVGASAKKTARKPAARAPKRAPAKCAPAKKETRHTDTKSHNVNIRVMSGAYSGKYDEKASLKMIDFLRRGIKKNYLRMENAKYIYDNYNELKKQNPNIDIPNKSNLLTEIQEQKNSIKRNENFIKMLNIRINKFQKQK